MEKHAPSLFAGMGGHQAARSKTDEWFTPPEIIEALGGHESFDLDPCTAPMPPFDTARTQWTAADHSLKRPWFGRVWLNPPYSQPLVGQFLGRMAGHGRGLVLIFARTETDHFQRFVWNCPHARAVFWFAGRLNFYEPDGSRSKENAGAPSVLIAYGDEDAALLDRFPFSGSAQPIKHRRPK